MHTYSDINLNEVTSEAVGVLYNENIYFSLVGWGMAKGMLDGKENLEAQSTEVDDEIELI